LIKKLTFEGRFECGLDEIVKGKAFAFVAVSNIEPHMPHYRLGVAIANERGYYPVPAHWAHSDSYDQMSAHADELNKAEGLEPKAAAMIVCSSMRGKAPMYKEGRG
jgi:hypothetical protein